MVPQTRVSREKGQPLQRKGAWSDVHTIHLSKVTGEALGPFQEVILDPDAPCSTVFVWQHLLQLIMAVTGHKL